MVNKSFDQIESRISDAVFVKISENVSTKLLFKDILYIKSDAMYSRIYFEAKGSSKNNYYTISQSSNNLIMKIGCPALVKVHKSYYVNIQRIERIQDGQIYIQGAITPIPIGREFKNEFSEKIKLIKHNSVQK